MVFENMDAKEREQLISEIQISLAKKKQCLSIAVKTVERLLDDPVSQQELLECCFHINQSYLKDVMEERGILMKCGYPICLNKLEKITRQQYHISTKYNKVFDLAERKYFCSNICYKSFKYLESQLPTCPLWLLDKEGPKDIRLFSVDSVETAEATPLPKKSEEEATLSPEPIMMPIKEEKRVAANEIDTETGDLNVDELSKGVKNVSLSSRKVQKIRKTVSAVGSLSVVVEKVLKEWITPKTLQLLFTAEQYAELLQTKSVISENSTDDALNDSTNPDEDLNQKYNVLSDIDSDLTSFELDDDSVARKAMPSYDQLVVDTREIYASVQAFYKGQSRQVVDSTIDGKTTLERPVDKVENVKFYTPLVDSQSQNALRTRIVLEKLNGASREILEMLKIPLSVITNEFRLLVHTFRLQARNITFKPREWFLLALLLINMISIKDKFVRDALTTESSHKILQNVLENFKLDATYLETTCKKLLDSVKEEIELD